MTNVVHFNQFLGDFSFKSANQDSNKSNTTHNTLLFNRFAHDTTNNQCLHLSHKYLSVYLSSSTVKTKRAYNRMQSGRWWGRFNPGFSTKQWDSSTSGSVMWTWAYNREVTDCCAVVWMIVPGQFHSPSRCEKCTLCLLHNERSTACGAPKNSERSKIAWVRVKITC